MRGRASCVRTTSTQPINLITWHVYHVWCADFLPAHHKYCICLCPINHWFYFIDSNPPLGRKAIQFTETIASFEAHFLTKDSYVATSPVKTFPDDRVAVALQNPHNDYGRLVQSVIDRIKVAAALNPSLKPDKKAVIAAAS